VTSNSHTPAPDPSPAPKPNLPTGGSRPEPQGARSRRSRWRGRGIDLPSVDDLLGKFLQLNGAMLTGLISSSQAGHIHKNLKVVLDAQFRRETRSDVPNPQALMDLARQDPGILNVLEPFLTDEQIDQLMQEIRDDPDDDPS
jgi:hypothetical protein